MEKHILCMLLDMLVRNLILDVRDQQEKVKEVL